MGINWAGLIGGATKAAAGIQQGKHDRAALEQEALHKALLERLTAAQIGHLGAQSQALATPKVGPGQYFTDDQGNVTYSTQGGPGTPVANVKGKRTVPPAPGFQLAQDRDGNYVWIPKPGAGTAPGSPSSSGTPSADAPAGSGNPPAGAPAGGAIKTGVEGKLSDQQLAAGGQADEAARALEIMMNIERRNPTAADKAASILSSQKIPWAGNTIAELRNYFSDDADAINYYNANQAFRLGIAGVRGQRGNQYLLDLERRATSRAPGEPSGVTPQRQEAQRAIIAELRRKGRQSDTPKSTYKPRHADNPY